MKDAVTTVVRPRGVRIFNAAPPPRVSPLLLRAVEAVVESELDTALRRTREQRRAEVELTVARAVRRARA